MNSSSSTAVPSPITSQTRKQIRDQEKKRNRGQRKQQKITGRNGSESYSQAKNMAYSAECVTSGGHPVFFQYNGPSTAKAANFLEKFKNAEEGLLGFFLSPQPDEDGHRCGLVYYKSKTAADSFSDSSCMTAGALIIFVRPMPASLTSKTDSLPDLRTLREKRFVFFSEGSPLLDSTISSLRAKSQGSASSRTNFPKLSQEEEKLMGSTKQANPKCLSKRGSISGASQHARAGSYLNQSSLSFNPHYSSKVIEERHLACLSPQTYVLSGRSGEKRVLRYKMYLAAPELDASQPKME
jgi:hypothetical protein